MNLSAHRSSNWWGTFNTVFQSVLAILFVFGMIVLVHEWGHMMAAKLCGVAVPDFAIGMGPSLWSFRRSGTRYHICAFPIGGFVRISGLEGDDALGGTKKELETLGSAGGPAREISIGDEEAGMAGRPASGNKTWRDINAWQRAFVLAAGPLMNFILALLIIFAMGAVGFPQDAVLITGVEKGSPAEAAGIKPGDLVTMVGDERVTNARQFSAVVHAHNNQTLTLAVNRDGQQVNLTSQPRVIQGYNEGKVSLGVTLEDQGFLTNQIGLIAPKSAVDRKLKTAGGQEIRLAIGDRIVGINGAPITRGLELYDKLAPVDLDTGETTQPADKDFTLDVQRVDGSRVQVTVPRDTTIISLGVQFEPELVHLPIGEGFVRSLQDANAYMVGMLWGMKMLFTRQGAQSISGPVGIVRMIGQSAKSSWHTFLFVFMLINLNLGLINLLPIPALDGGRLVFVVLNGIGVRINEKREALVHMLGMVLLLTFIGLVTCTDILAWL